MVEKLASRLIDERIINISETFPAVNGDQYLELAFALFKAGIYRMPIIGTSIGSSTVSLMLVSNDIQEHAQLGKEADIDPEQIVYTSSIEGLPTKNPDPFLFYLKVLTSGQDTYQRIGRGSDHYSPSLNKDGMKELTRILAQVGVFN